MLSALKKKKINPFPHVVILSIETGNLWQFVINLFYYIFPYIHFLFINNNFHYFPFYLAFPNIKLKLK